MKAALGTLCAVLMLAGCEKDDPVERISGPTMGSSYTVQYVRPAEGPDAEQVQREIEGILASIDQQFSTYRSDSMVARSLGVSLQTRLAAADSPAHSEALALRRQLAWEVEMGLQHVGPGQPVSFAQWRQAWDMPAANELTVARALLKLQQLPPEPPADYAPAWDR